MSGRIRPVWVWNRHRNQMCCASVVERVVGSELGNLVRVVRFSHSNLDRAQRKAGSLGGLVCGH